MDQKKRKLKSTAVPDAYHSEEQSCIPQQVRNNDVYYRYYITQEGRFSDLFNNPVEH